MKRLSFLILVFFILLLASDVTANPPIPCEFYGNVTINGTPAPVDTEISAIVNGTVRDQITVLVEGVYGGPGGWEDKLTVQVSEDEYACGCAIPIEFFINGVTADQTSTFIAGQNIRLNLSCQTGDIEPSAPEADFYASPREGGAPLDVLFTDNSAGTVTTWLWDFGDGTNGIGALLDHTYEDPGLYNVTLTVDSEYGSNSTTKIHYIKVTQVPPSIVNFYADPLEGEAPLDVVFTDVSEGVVTTRFWDFGDGTSTWENETPSVTHTYPLPGTYSIRLTAGNDAGEASLTLKYIEVSPSGSPPDARFSTMPMMGYAPLTVRFSDRSAGMPIKWQWDFGDGNTSSEQNPSHTYATAGKYTPSLTVYNSGGSDSSFSNVWVRTTRIGSPTSTPSPSVTTTPPLPPGTVRSPISFFAINKSFGSAPMSVQFTDKSFNSPTSWQWDFGDGHTSTLQNPTFTFTEPGTYSVSLTVANSNGESTMSRRVNVR